MNERLKSISESNLLQNVNATFEWVRLAQRIPVRIKLINVPKDTILSSGMTVTVSIIQGTSPNKQRIAEIQSAVPGKLTDFVKKNGNQ